jgi:hypothetical protein
MINSFKAYTNYINNLTEHLVTDQSGLLKGKNLLYHNTDTKLFKHIIETDSLKGSTQPVLNKQIKGGISFTRSFDFHFDRFIKIIFDKDLLKKAGYSFTPYDFFWDLDVSDKIEKEVGPVEDWEDLNKIIPKEQILSFKKETPFRKDEFEEIGPAIITPVIPFIKGVVYKWGYDYSQELTNTLLFDKMDLNEKNILSHLRTWSTIEQFIKTIDYCKSINKPLWIYFDKKLFELNKLEIETNLENLNKGLEDLLQTDDFKIIEVLLFYTQSLKKWGEWYIKDFNIRNYPIWKQIEGTFYERLFKKDY